MNGAVHPVEIRVMNHEHQWDREQVIACSEVVDGCIQVGVRTKHDDHQQKDRGENHRGLHRVDDFLQHLVVFRESQLDFFPEERIAEQHIKQQVSSSRDH